MAEGQGNVEELQFQKQKINELLKKELKKGDTWYLIDNHWFKQWKQYVGYESTDNGNIGKKTFHPGPIDNSSLFEEGNSGEVKEQMVDEQDYILVSEEAWCALVEWYSLLENQEPIARKVVEDGTFVQHRKVEVYLVKLKLCQNSSENCVLKKFSKADKIDGVEKEMKKLFSIPDDSETRLWNRYCTSAFEQVTKKDGTIQDAGLSTDQILMIEQKNEDGTWPQQFKSNAHYGYSAYSSYGEIGMGNTQKGLCGLSNLGNTCFMNSVLQCMSNTPPITRYFLEDGYWNDINEENPLGMRGEIAKSFGELIKTMWSGHYTYTAPRNFKMQVGRFAPQFSGYQQHDSQELLTFLLDGLHEDLNRIKKKPYIELRDADGRPDEEVAVEAWNNYKQRNDSIIVDIFHGLLKSTVVCPECYKISVTFDPMCYLSLPLPVKKERQIEVFFVPLDPTKCVMQYKVTVPKVGTARDICLALSKFTEVRTEHMVVTDVYRCRFHKIYASEETLNNMADTNDIFVYEVQLAVSDKEACVTAVYLREKQIHGMKLFGQPIILTVQRQDCTYSLLYEHILQRLSRYITRPNDNEEWWLEPSHLQNGEVEMSCGNEDDGDIFPFEEENRNSPADSEGELPSNDNFSDDSTFCTHEKPHLFTMHLVNLFGSNNLKSLADDGKVIIFSDRTYVAVDWHPRARELFYNEKADDDIEHHESYHYRPSPRKQVIQLQECLELYTTTEKLGADNAWYCPCCKKHQQATKKFDVWSLSQLLVIHLKRFFYDRYWRNKIDTLVEFPVTSLNMAPYIINKHHPPASYDLIGVCNHFGSLAGGHYTAYAKNKGDGQWYYFDDSSVSRHQENDVCSNAAYVLFYWRNDSSTPACHQSDVDIPHGHTSSDEEMDTN